MNQEKGLRGFYDKASGVTQCNLVILFGQNSPDAPKIHGVGTYTSSFLGKNVKELVTV